MPTIKQQLALRTKLQALEDALVKQGKHHIIARTERGTFEWMLPGMMNEPPEILESGELRAIEDMIIAQGWEDIMIATERVTFSWEPN